MTRAKHRHIVLAAVLAVLALSIVPAQAKNPNNPGGGGNDGGGAAYTIVPLTLPDVDTSHHGVPESISDLGPAGEVHVVGYDYQTDRPYRWTLDATGNVDVEDISPWFGYHDLDVNSAGVVCGWTNTEPVDRSPALLFPDGTFVVLPPSYASVRLNNPDEQGVFQVVGGHVLWDVAIDGTILAATSLVDADGTELYACDVNDYEEIAGRVYVDNDPSKQRIPAIGRFAEGRLQISLLVNPSPDVITGFSDMQIDNGGNLVGYGTEPATPIGYYPRAVIWPATGGAIDLVREYPTLNTAEGNGIATVGGVMQVVGVAHANSGTFAYLYAGGVLSDLDRLSEGDEPWDISAVEGINHAGMICGYGRVGKRHGYRGEACLLIPTNR